MSLYIFTNPISFPLPVRDLSSKHFLYSSAFVYFKTLIHRSTILKDATISFHSIDGCISLVIDLFLLCCHSQKTVIDENHRHPQVSLTAIVKNRSATKPSLHNQVREIAFISLFPLS